jgi:integrase
MEFINNPHCNKPFLAIDGNNWYIQFWYKVDGKRLPKKEAFNLNSDEFRVKSKGKITEINKVKRKEYVDIYLEKLTDLLKSRYFNPYTKQFVILDESEKPLIYFIEKFLNNPYLTKEVSTLKTYTSYFEVFKKFLLENNLSEITLKEVGKNLVNDYLSQFKTATHSNGNLRFLKAVLNYCVNDLEVIPTSPLKSIKPQPVPDSDSNKPYSQEEFRKLLTVAKSIDNEFYLLLLMQYYTLRRPTEILKLQFKDFDFNTNSVYFSGKISKTKKRQTAILPPFFMDLIKSQVPEDVKPNHYFLGTVKQKNGHHTLKVFNESPITTMYFQDKFKTKAIQNLIKKGQTMYSVKHSGVIYLKEKGYSNQQIMGITGHAKESTLGIYAREYKAAPIVRADNLLV